MRTLEKIGIGLGVSLLTVMALVIAATAFIWWRPGLILNNRNLARAQGFLQRSGHELTWSSGHIEASSLSFWDKRVRISFTDLCFALPDKSFRSCFDESDITLRADLYWKGPRLTVIGPVLVRGRELVYRAPEQAPKPTPANKSGGGVPYWIESAKIEDVSIQTPWRFAQKDSVFSGDAAIEGASRGKGVQLNGRVSMVQEAGGQQKSQSAHVEFTASNELSPWTVESWDADLKGDWKTAQQSVQARAKLRRAGPEGGRLGLDAHFKQAALRCDLRADGSFKDQLAGAIVNAKLRGLNPRLQLVDFERCRLAAKWKVGEVRDATLEINECKTWLALTDLRRFAERRKLRVASRVGLGWKASLSSFVSPTPDRPLKGNLDMALDALPNEVIQLSGRGKVDFTATAYGAKALNASANAQIDGLVTDFQVLVKALARNGITVPAPLHTLGGRIQISVKAEGDMQNQGFKIPFRVETRLGSELQRFNAVASGELSLPSKTAGGVAKPLPKLKADFALNDVSLVLPRLELRAPPPVLPDSRIHKIRPAGAKPKMPALNYVVRIFTLKDKPLQLKTNLAPTPVPLALDVRIESDSEHPYGFVAVRDYHLELFRRKALIQSFVMDLKGERELDGKIRFALPQYTIEMLVMGTASRPQVQFISDPPLAPEEITAVLVFGKTIEELDANGRTSADGMRAALANGAMSLASLYFLASTPIESINYNSSTGEVMAQVKIGKGMTLNVGATSEQVESVGVTKRLGKNWRLSTEVSDPQNFETASLRSVIEWFMRY